ncbi:hypothetical protein, partial [Limimaricola soesokkakensis]|uniref:hypothetical protein n=1 Tax=Limimaricola soesokkakensis TaxID=1343159 RepID=UPI003515BF13
HLGRAGRSVDLADFLDFRLDVVAVEPAFEPAFLFDGDDLVVIQIGAVVDTGGVFILAQERVVVRVEIGVVVGVILTVECAELLLIEEAVVIRVIGMPRSSSRPTTA